jgi:hypothetical protein
VRHPHSTVAFVLGPPGAGKTTMGRAVATQLHAPFHSIDEWVNEVYPPEAQTRPMTDAQVDAALSLLFQQVRRESGVYEFAHHDYVDLWRREAYEPFKAAPIIIMVAPLPVCHARNAVRRSPVRRGYLERAWLSTQALIERCADGNLPNALIVDTNRTAVGAAVAAVVDFVTAWEVQL